MRLRRWFGRPREVEEQPVPLELQIEPERGQPPEAPRQEEPAGRGPRSRRIPGAFA